MPPPRLVGYREYCRLKGHEVRAAGQGTPSGRRPLLRAAILTPPACPFRQRYQRDRLRKDPVKPDGQLYFVRRISANPTEDVRLWGRPPHEPSHGWHL